MNELDEYATPIQLNFDGKMEKITSAFGGLMSINYYIAFTLYCILQIVIMHNKSDVDFEEGEMIMSQNQFHGKTLAEYNDTFNMIIGTVNVDIDLLNNGFI